MLLNSETLLRLGKIYITRSLSAPPERFTANATIAVKCFDLSLIEQDNVLARAYRLFFGSYMKLMTSKSPEIMNYVEKDFADLKKDAEKTEHKKEIMLLTNEVLGVLRNAYSDRHFDFAGRFDDFAELCTSIERFLTPATAPKEESRKLGQKEIAKLHTDVEIIQRKISLLIERLGAAGDEDSTAQALRLSTELAKIDTGVYADYRIAESCLKNIVSRQNLPDSEKSDLLYKVLLIGKNGLPQVDIVVDQLLKSLKVEPRPEEKATAGGREGAAGEKEAAVPPPRVHRHRRAGHPDRGWCCSLRPTSSATFRCPSRCRSRGLTNNHMARCTISPIGTTY